MVRTELFMTEKSATVWVRLALDGYLILATATVPGEWIPKMQTHIRLDFKDGPPVRLVFPDGEVDLKDPAHRLDIHLIGAEPVSQVDKSDSDG